MEDVVSNLVDLDRYVKDRGESSAKEIKRQLNTIRNNLLRVAFDEETAEDIIKLLEEEE